MGENFLNSYAFEQMAKEYSRKYSLNSVDILKLKKDDKLLLKVDNIFNKVFRLFYLLEKCFAKNIKFRNLFLDIEKFKEDFLTCYKSMYEKEFNTLSCKSLGVVNHKICANLML